MTTVKQQANTFHYPIKINLPDVSATTFYAANRIARTYNLCLPTLSEFIRTLEYDPEFREKSQGRSYWLRGKTRIESTGLCRIDYENGTIIPISRAELSGLPAQLCAYSYTGDGPLRLSVHTDYSIAVSAIRVAKMNSSVALVEDDTTKLLAKARDALASLKRDFPA